MDSNADGAVAVENGAETLPANDEKLPEVQPEDIPVLVFVNMKSGGQKGEKIFAEFAALLPKENMFKLQEGGLDAAIKQCYTERKTILVKGTPEKARIIVAGGDGTVGWVVSGIDKHGTDNSLTPIAHLPLGTGNDMARSTGWGGGYDGGSPQKILDAVRRANPQKLDRWLMTIKGKNGSVSGEKTDLMLYNYFSIGADAHVAYLFHHMREANPDRFKSRSKNKYYYMQCGLKATLAGARPLSHTTKITAEGEEVRFPNSVRTIIGLNIQSYMAGADLWGSSAGGYAPTCCCLHPSSDFPAGSMGDGKVDILGIKSNFKQGFIKTFNCTGVRIEQASDITFESEVANYVQADGEPWTVDGPFTLNVKVTDSVTMLIR